MAAQVDGDDAVAGREFVEHPGAPALRGLRPTVQEHQGPRVGVTGHRVDEGRAVDADCFTNSHGVTIEASSAATAATA